jgi:hypothetical protein
MPKDTLRRTRTLAAVAVAVASAGAFAVAPAHAAPGNCEQWGFSGPTNIKLSTGPIVTFEANGARVASWATDARQDNGNISGEISPNGFVVLIYQSETFPNDPPLKLVGDVIGDNGQARGNFTAKLNGTWELATPLKCLTPAGGTAGTAGGNSREVTGDVDAYDSPGGTGTVLGQLQGGEGQRVNLGSGCRDDNWCNVAFPAGPGGTAWVWGDFLK